VTDIDRVAYRLFPRSFTGSRSAQVIAAKAKPIAPIAILLLGDVVAYLASYGILRLTEPFNIPVLDRAFLLIAILTMALYAWASLYPGYCLYQHEHTRRRVVAALGMAAVACLGTAFIFEDWLSALLLVAFILIALALQFLIRPTARKLAHRLGCWGELVAIDASPNVSGLLRDYFRKNWEYGIIPISPFPDGVAGAADASTGGPNGRRRGAAKVLLATERMPHRSELAEYRRRYAEVILLANLPDCGISGLEPANVNGQIGLRMGRAETTNSLATVLHRLFDLLIASAGVVCAAPVIVGAGIAIWIVDPGPIIYRQKREGFGGKSIHVLKLRTMYTDAEQRLDQLLRHDPSASIEWNAHFKLKNDPRILPWIGRFLRKTSFDELPQFLNVIAGDMAIVGPRPFPEYHVAALNADFRKKRSTLTPGVTGLWQVSERSDADLELQQQLDEFYIENRSFWFDASICCATFRAMMKRSGV
jgi:lipopolysaccharide/colanic/teichoic acid biosynthesis glycosyltransferase